MKTAKDYQKKIKWGVSNHDVCQAAKIALWLIVDKNATFQRAIKVSTRKTGAKVSPTEKLVRSILPVDYLRKKAAARMSPELKQAIRSNKIADHKTRKFIESEK